MRVLMLDQTGQLGGAELALVELCEHAHFDWDAVLFSDGPLRARLEQHGGKVDVVSSNAVAGIRRDHAPPSKLKVLRGIATMVWNIAKKAKRYDIIYANTQKAMVIGALAGLIARRPLVFYLHDIVTTQHFGRAQLAVLKWTTKLLVAEVVCNSQATKNAFVTLTHCIESSVSVIYNGISTIGYDRAAEVPKALHRKRFDLPADVYLVGCFSRLSYWKGQHVLLDTIAKDQTAHALFVGSALFGEEAYAAELLQRAQNLGLNDRVHFLGFQTDIPALMSAVDLVAHTSVAPEPFGRVIVEGMLARRPVIATGAGGVLEIIDEGINGLLVPLNDAAALHRAISTFRKAPELSAHFAAAGRSKATMNFSPSKHSRGITEVLLRHVTAK